MTSRRSLWPLLLVMTLVAAGVGAAAVTSLYRAAVRQEGDRLVHLARSQARFLEVVAHFDMEQAGDYPGGPFQATLGQFLEASRGFAGMGESGELVLAQRDGEWMRVLFRHRAETVMAPDSLPVRGELGEPQRRALAGQSGVMVTHDYLGERVLAAYEPVGVYDLGIVAKIDLKEVRAPFVRAGLLAGGVGVLLVLVGSVLFLKLSDPLLRELRESEENYRLLAENTTDGIWMMSSDLRFTYVNPAVEAVLGYTPEEWVGSSLVDHCLPEDFARVREAVAEMSRDPGAWREGALMEIRLLRRDGTPVPMEVSARPFLHPGQSLRFQGVARDISERVAREEALRESEAFVRAVMDALPIGVAVNSVDPSVEFLYMNDNFPRLYRTTREALADPDAFWEAAYQDPGFREYMRDRVLADVASGEPRRMFWGDVPITREGEETTYISARNTPVPSRGVMISTVWDVTQQVQAQEFLRASEERYRRLAENSVDLIYRYRVAPDPGFEYVNPAATAMTGYTPEEHYADPQLGLKLVHPEDRHLVEAFFSPASVEDTSKPLTLRWIRKSGETLWTEQRNVFLYGGDGALVAVEGIARDVTSQKEMELALRTSEARYRELFHANPLPMWVYDLETLAFLDVNDAAIRHYGYSRGGFLAMTIKDIRPPEDIPRLLEDVARTTDTLNDAGVWRHLVKDGSVISVEIRSHSVEVEGRPGRLVLANDVTDRLAAEEGIRRLNVELEGRIQERTAELARANEELEAFTYTVSHDLKAPLRAIDGFSRILEKDYGQALDHEGLRVLGVVRASSAHMAELIDDLLAFSRLGRTELRTSPVDLGALVESALEDLRPGMDGRQLDLVVGDLPTVFGDRLLLRQVLVNLLSNALKFTSQRELARIRVGCRKENSEVVVFVQDNGVGFDPEYGHKLFGVFQRLHHADEFPGTGVGLANVRLIVERHGGRVWAEAKPGEGASFYVALPGDGGEEA
jgi:PAS domain S-box-containing protein